MCRVDGKPTIAAYRMNDREAQEAHKALLLRRTTFSALR